MTDFNFVQAIDPTAFAQALNDRLRPKPGMVEKHWVLYHPKRREREYVALIRDCDEEDAKGFGGRVYFVAAQDAHTLKERIRETAKADGVQLLSTDISAFPDGIKLYSAIVSPIIGETKKKGRGRPPKNGEKKDDVKDDPKESGNADPTSSEGGDGE